MSHPIERLFSELRSVEPYPSGVVATEGRIAGTAFFPGGTGLWAQRPSSAPPIPAGGVMVVGQDFHTLEGFRGSRDSGGEVIVTEAGDVASSSATWTTLIKFLPRVGIPLERCFFTNAYMGLRETGPPTGKFVGSKCPFFSDRCREFFVRQLATVQPRLVLSLGAWVPRFLAPLSDSLDDWRTATTLQQVDRIGPVRHNVIFRDIANPVSVIGLTHPSFRGPNVGRRLYAGAEGDAAERRMIADGIAHSGVDLRIL